MNELTIHDVPADVLKALRADAARTNQSVDDIARHVLLLYAQRANKHASLIAARTDMDRIRGQIRKRHGTLDVVVPILREDRSR